MTANQQQQDWRCLDGDCKLQTPHCRNPHSSSDLRCRNLDSSVWNTPSAKMLCPQTVCLSLYFFVCKNTTYQMLVCWESVKIFPYLWIVANWCFMKDVLCYLSKQEIWQRMVYYREQCVDQRVPKLQYGVSWYRNGSDRSVPQSIVSERVVL